MKEGARNALVGMFVIASLAVLAWLMVMFGEKPRWLGGDEWDLTITGFKEIRGIGEGTTVYLNGVEVGRVKRLDFKDPNRPGLGVKIICGIKKRYAIPRQAVARIYGATLGIGQGQVHIVVEPGPGLTPAPQDGTGGIHGEMRSAVNEIITEEFLGSFQRTVDHIGSLAAEAVPVAKNLADLLERRSVDDIRRPGAQARGEIANLATIVERIDKLLANVNAVLGDTDVQGNLKSIAGDLKGSSTELRELVQLWHNETRRISDNANSGIDRTEENLDQTFAKLITVIENLDESTKNLAGILQGVSEGQGTAGLLVRDERLYESGVLALQRIADLASSLSRITSKIERDGYITVGKKTAVGTFTKDFPVDAQGGGKK